MVFPIIGAAVSLISGVSALSAKNKAANAQREQIAAESKANAQRTMSQEISLRAAAEAAQTQYQMGMIARLSQAQQADMALQAQKAAKALAAQQQAYSAEAGALQGSAQAAAQANALARQSTQIQVGSDAQRQATDLKTAQKTDAATQQLQQTEQQLTQAERQRIATESALRIGSTSSNVRSDKAVMQRVATALSAGLGLDQTALEAEMQAMTQDEMTAIAERLGLMDNANAVDSVAAGLRMLRTQTDAQLQNIQSDQALTNSAIDVARQTNALTSELDMRGSTSAYNNQQTSIGTQRTLNTQTGQQLADSSAAQARSVRGAGLTDWLNMGLNTYGAISPLLSRGSTGGMLGRAASGVSNSTPIYVPPPENSDITQYIGGSRDITGTDWLRYP